MFGHGELCEAIAKRRIVSFRYKDETRTVESHLVGYDKAGELTLSAWQTAPKEGWRDFHVDKLSFLNVTDQTFDRARPDYNPGDSTMQRAVCRL